MQRRNAGAATWALVSQALGSGVGVLGTALTGDSSIDNISSLPASAASQMIINHDGSFTSAGDLDLANSSEHLTKEDRHRIKLRKELLGENAQDGDPTSFSEGGRREESLSHDAAAVPEDDVPQYYIS